MISMIFDLSKFLTSSDSSISEVMELIDANFNQIALVVDQFGILQGTVTDGDIRRALIKGIKLSAQVRECMHCNPRTVPENTSDVVIKQMMRQHNILHIPILDESGRPIALAKSNAVLQKPKIDAQVVLMAGGLGMRLRPLTLDRPKPMLEIGNRPLLEHIIQDFKGSGFRNFTLSVNYLSHVIKDYFFDGSQFGVNIQYAEETKRLGTAGALSMLDNKISDSFILMNGDILTNLDKKHFLETHKSSGADITIYVRNYTTRVPFGVITASENIFEGIEEKPIINHMVSAGVYALEPVVFEYISQNEALDMPDLITRIKQAGKKVCIYKSDCYWRDIGRIEDFEQAKSEINDIYNYII